MPPAINCAEDGKTELSLIHFTLTNPKWQMPQEAEHFVKTLKKNALKEFETAHLADQPGALMSSLHTVSSMSAGYNSVVQSIIQNAVMNQSSTGPSSYFGHQELDTATGEFNAMLQTDLSHSTLPSSSHEYSVAPERNKTSFILGSQVKGGLNRAEGPAFSERGLLHR